MKYQARVHDILIHTFYVSGSIMQRIYRVVSIQLGGERQEGAVELEPLNHSKHDVYDYGAINSYVPHLLLDQMVQTEILECVWRKPLIERSNVPMGKGFITVEKKDVDSCYHETIMKTG